MAKINFTLTQIEYVLAIEKHGNFSKAANACLITQPTLSMQIQKLEESLGLVLFDRSKKPIKVTERARPLIQQMKAVFLEVQKMEELVSGSKLGPLAGDLTLGIIPTLAPYLLPIILPQLSQNLPNLRLEIREMQTSEIVKALNSDEIDVGILALSLSSPQFVERSLFWEPFSIICAKNHPLSKYKKVKQSELTFDDLWLLEEGHCMRTQVLDLCSVKGKKKARSQCHFESGSIETLKNLVDAIGGYTLVPYLAANNLKDQTQLIAFDRPVPAREIGLVTRRAHFKMELIQAVEAQIIQALPSRLKQLKNTDVELMPID